MTPLSNDIDPWTVLLSTMVFNRSMHVGQNHQMFCAMHLMLVSRDCHTLHVVAESAQQVYCPCWGTQASSIGAAIRVRLVQRWSHQTVFFGLAKRFAINVQGEGVGAGCNVHLQSGILGALCSAILPQFAPSARLFPPARPSLPSLSPATTPVPQVGGFTVLGLRSCLSRMLECPCAVSLNCFILAATLSGNFLRAFLCSLDVGVFYKYGSLVLAASVSILLS